MKRFESVPTTRSANSGRTNRRGDWEKFEKNLTFAYAEEDGTGELVGAVARAEEEIGGNVQRLFHLAVPPGALLGIIEMLGKTGLNENTKIICESLSEPTSRRRAVSTPRSPRVFRRVHVFRIDHFLGRSQSTTSSR